MAALDRLIKASEALKAVQPCSNTEESAQKKKEMNNNSKEKIMNCSIVVDAICSNQLRGSTDFPKFLGLAMDTFLLCCDDGNSDVRLMADECLNRTIKTCLDTHLGRILVELFKEIKKNGAARSLRAALSRFGDICHLIRPQKFRPYTVNLVPALVKISQRREEESVQETLAIVVTKFMPVLGQFTVDKDIKMLLKAFLPNLTVSSANIRRAAATSLTCICQYSRRPSSFFGWILIALFDLILPVQVEHPVSTVLGVLVCLRHIVPHLSESMLLISAKNQVSIIQPEDEMGVTIEHLLKVYEISLYFTHHPDHNVITATLETLFQLLKCASNVLQQVLVSPFGITKSLIFDVPKLSRTMSESQSSIVPSSASIDESCLEDDHDIFIPTKKIDDQLSCCEDDTKSNFDASVASASLSLDGDSEDISDHSNVQLRPDSDETYCFLNSEGKKKASVLKKGASDENMLDTDDEFWDHSASTPSPGPVSKMEFKIGCIGSYTDQDIPLKYCSRLLCSSFLLAGTPGGCIPDKNVRISVKSLALGCLSSVFSLYPSGFFLPLHKDGVRMDGRGDGSSAGDQQIWDVVLYASHSDPHLKGQASVMIGYFLGSALRESGGWWSKWVADHTDLNAPTLPSLLSKLISVVKDESSVASKLGLVGMKQCLNLLLNSVNALESFPILEILLKVKNNSYWLSKVELAELVSSISFKAVSYLESKYVSKNSLCGKTSYQNKVLNDILIPLLGDEDVRVRQAAAAGFVRSVSELFFPIDHPNKDPIIAIAKISIGSYLDVSCKSSFSSTLPLVHALVKPFSVHNSISYNSVVDASLSKVINLLVTTLKTCTNKYLIYGCCHALNLLSEKYLVTVFPETWTSVISDFKEDHSPFEAESVFSCLIDETATQSLYTDLISHLISLITSTSLCLDLVAHQHTLQLVGNLLCGIWYKYFVDNQKNNLNSQEVKPESYISFTIMDVFQHLMRVLNIFTHVLDEQYPIQINTRSTLPSLPNAPSLSPIKRKKGKEDSPPAGSFVKGSPIKAIEKGEIERDRTSSRLGGNIGLFHNSPLYMKLFEILKGAHTSYKISMDFQSSEKFCQLLKCVLDVMCQILEISDSNEMGKSAEEILYYLKSVMAMEVSSSVQCVRQLLKCLFGTNLVILCQEAQLVLGVNKKCSSSSRISSCVPGLYYTCITSPYTEFTHSLAEKAVKGLSPDESNELVSFRCLNWVKRGDKLTNVLKSGSKGEKANLASHIRLFEGVVIRSLQQYTVSSDITLQCQVLDLLAQLVQLRVNYCLLDADQVFITYVIKQFELIEEGQILKADILIPRIFYFLILLSYERFHSKPIISVPKILQLCDGLIASGQPPEKYVIPALQPVIEDLFLLRSMNKIDVSKELDAQREVLVSTLFKLVSYPQVLELFILIVNHSHQEGEDKWKKTSRQVVDVILPLLSRQQIQIENQEHLNILHRLLERVASNVFRPVDILLKALFTPPKDLNVPPNINRWMSMVLTVLRVLINQANEEAVLSRLADMGISIKIYKLGLSPSLICEKEQADNVSKDFTDSVPGATFSRFLFQVLGVVVESLYNHAFMHALNFADNTFLCQQAAHLLLYLTFMFQSGTFRTVTTAAMGIIKEESDGGGSAEFPVYYSILDIETLFHKIAPIYPTLVIQWCNILTLLNYDNRSFWLKIVHPCQELTEIESTHISVQPAENLEVFLPCNLEMVRRGGIILLCDYVCENPTDVVQLTWLIVHHVKDIIDLSLETTVQDFISFIHRNAAASGLWIQAIINAHQCISKPHFWKQALHCLEKIHLSQSGKLLTLVVNHLFPTHHLLVADFCDRLACKRMEYLLGEPDANQLSVQDLDSFVTCIEANGISDRHKKFLSLCDKLKVSLSAVESPSSTHPLVEPSIQIQHILLNKDWYIKFVKKECFEGQTPAKECAHLLSHLKYEDILSIMVSKDFQLPIIEQCLSLGAKLVSSNEKYLTTKSHDPFIGVTESPGSALYRSAQSTLLQHLADFMTLIPRASKHQNRMHKLFSEKSFWEILFFLVPSTSRCLETLDILPDKNILKEFLEDIVHLSIICCEAVVWLIDSTGSVSSEMLRTCLVLLDKTLKNTELSFNIGLPSNVNRICLAISSVHFIVKSLLQNKDLLTQPVLLENTTILMDKNNAQTACIEIVQLIGWLEKCSDNCTTISKHLFDPLKSVIRGLARLPLVNSFARTPPILWLMSWNPELSGDFKTLVPPPPGEFLQDRDVLKQYIFRINLLGWISRQQFEETWMALLGVLSATPVDDIDGKEEDQERIRTSCLAVKSITALLLQTLLLPEPGNPQNSYFLLQPRDKPLAFQHTKCGKKLMYVRLPIHAALQKLLQFERLDEQILNINSERIATSYPYSLSQVSLEYLNAAVGLLEDNEDIDGSASSNSSPLSTNAGGVASFHLREQSLNAVGLDIHSCLHFLLDLYSQWLSSQTCPYTPLTLLTEVTKSVVALSDIFMEKTQFEWMLDTFLEVQRIHPAEDEVIAQYLIFGICKAAAVLGVEQDVLDKLKKLLELSLKSSYLPTKISTLHGLLYLLEQGGGDNSFPLLPTATEYILKNLETFDCLRPCTDNEDHILILWAVTFYIMENFQDEISDEEFTQKVYQVCLLVCSQTSEHASRSVFLTVLHGLERLLVAEILSGKEANVFLKLSVERIRSGTPVFSMAALGFFLSCMYIGKSTNMWSNELVPDASKTLEKNHQSGRQIDNEFLLVAMERVSTLFDRIKKANPCEAEILCEILPGFLMEFFPVQEILNKIITEFLSNQQPHPQLMAKVIFEVFQYLHKQSQEEVIHEWVLLSLSNFMQRSPLSMAIWSLSCFFISATTNYWFQALFPHIQNRMGKMEEIDRVLFCIAGVNFRDQLHNDEQKQAYFNTIQSVALPHTPYADLLSCL